MGANNEPSPKSHIFVGGINHSQMGGSWHCSIHMIVCSITFYPYILGQSYMGTLILTSLLVLMGISTFTSKEFKSFFAGYLADWQSIVHYTPILSTFDTNWCLLVGGFKQIGNVFFSLMGFLQPKIDCWFRWVGIVGPTGFKCQNRFQSTKLTQQLASN